MPSPPAVGARPTRIRTPSRPHRVVPLRGHGLPGRRGRSARPGTAGPARALAAWWRPRRPARAAGPPAVTGRAPDPAGTRDVAGRGGPGRRRRPADRRARRRSAHPARRGRGRGRRTPHGQNPGATARVNRPSATWSSVIACLASQVMSRRGSTAALSPSAAVGNRPASHASSVQGSIAPDQVGKSGLWSRPSPSHSVVMPTGDGQPGQGARHRPGSSRRVRCRAAPLATVGSPAMVAEHRPRTPPGSGCGCSRSTRAGALADVIVAAESAGLDELWLGDEGPARDPLVTLAAAAHRTKRIRLGVAVTNPYLRHPASTASAFATLAELAPRAGGPRDGRRRRARSRSGRPRARATAPAGDRRRSRRPGRAAGRGHRPGYRPPAHAPRAPDVPIYIGARGERLNRLASEVADGVFLGGIALPMLGTTIGWARSAGPSHVAIYPNVAFSADDVESIRPQMVYALLDAAAPDPGHARGGAGPVEARGASVAAGRSPGPPADRRPPARPPPRAGHARVEVGRRLAALARRHARDERRGGLRGRRPGRRPRPASRRTAQRFRRAVADDTLARDEPTPVRRRWSSSTDAAPVATSTLGFRTRAVHAGGRPDPTTGRPRRADLPDDQLRVRGHARRLLALRPPEVRQHLQPHRQPDGGGLRGAHGQPGGWPRAPWPPPAARRAELLVFIALAGAGRPHRRVVAPLRRHPHAARRHAAPASASTPRSWTVTSPADFAAAVRPETKAIYAEVIGNPSGAIADLAGLADVAHAHGVPLVVDATLATPVPVPADRARRRHRGALGHQVPRRPRHVHRRRGRRVRPVRLGRRPLPAHDRAGGRPTAACRGGATSPSTASSPGCAPSSSATWAPP